MMPLLTADIGDEVEVLRCNFDSDIKRRMESLGVLPGERITPIARNEGNLIIKVQNSRFAINAGIASRIYVA